MTYPANKLAKEEVACVGLNRSLEESLQHVGVHYPAEKQFKGCLKGRGRLRAVALHGQAGIEKNFDFDQSLEREQKPSVEEPCGIHIHNRLNVNTLKIKSEKQNSDEFANLQYVNIFVENQPVTALIDSGCQIPVLNSSLIRVQTPSVEIITLSSCFGEQRMVEVKPINLSLNQHSSGLSVQTAISLTLTDEFIIHSSVYSEIKKLGHAKSDVLLSESGSSLSADSGVSFPNVSVSILVCSVFFVCFRFSSGLDEKGKKEDVPLRTAYSQAGRLWQPKPSSLRAQAQLSETKTETRKL
ncbi:hypothetical protein TNCV_959491 [Trichonephila clavipes]|nr:hypothetical protein TNCV_959491 [Trichonephila clavipes]